MISPQDKLILQLIAQDGKNVASRLAEKHGVTRQATSSWLARLRKRGLIDSVGRGPGVRYALRPLFEFHRSFARATLREDSAWAECFAPAMAALPANVRDIWHYAITEMINNAIDHSGSQNVTVGLRQDALKNTAYISDLGEGIFNKIQRALNLYDPREAILELAKGKLTTDPAHHTGEGIFFSSKVMDGFEIRSGNLHFMLDGADDDSLLERDLGALGTSVIMRLANDSPRQLQDVFNQFAAPEEYTFAKTVVPVALAQYEGEKLVSRSQAKRLTMRFERFQIVVLDFSGVAEIGQAFADEVFRVFQKAHPQTRLVPDNMTAAVEKMVRRALAAYEQQ